MVEFSMQNFQLNNKVAIITGGASGLGRYYSLALSTAGANLFVVSRTEKGWADLKAQVAKHNSKVVFMKKDVTEKGAAKEIVAQAINAYGRIDILINNAGINLRHKLLDFPDKDWQAVIDLNLNSVYYLSHEVAKKMVKQKSGKIINVGSMLSYRAGKFIFPYTASKHGVLGLTRAYADALAADNIQVNGIAPGYINTPMTKPLQEDPVRSVEIKNHIPAGHWADPTELMGTIVFLASDASNYLNGVMLPVDGGYLLR